MDWLIVLAFILLGLTLIATEIIFIPGTTIIGFIGFFTAIGGIYYGYDTYGRFIGHGILGGTVIIGSAMVYFCLKFEVWKMFALDKQLEGKIIKNVNSTIQVGQEGITTSALRPMGSVEFNGTLVEVKTNGNYIESNQSVKIIKINNDTIIVESV